MKSQASKASLLSLLVLTFTASVFAATEWWDASTDAGLQHGNGTWSADAADTYWSSAVGGATPLAPWTNGNDATFAAVSGMSTVSVSGAVTANVITVSGSAYLLAITNGATLYTTNAPLIGNVAGMNSNGVLVQGGPGGASVWNLGGKILTVGSAAVNTNNYAILDGAGTPGSAVMTNLGGLAIRGDGGSFTLTNGARFYGNGAFGSFKLGDAGNGQNLRVYIGTNCLLDFGTGSVASCRMSLGSSGSSNDVLIVDGGILTNVWYGGTHPVSGTNSGLIVTNGGSVCINNGSLPCTLSSFILIDNGLVSMLSAGNASVGGQSRVVVDNGGRLYTTGETRIGDTGDSLNSIRVTGGSTWNSGFSTINIGPNAGAYSNTFLVDNSVVTNIQRFQLGSGGKWNTATLTNGGKLFIASSGGYTRDVGNSAGAYSNTMRIVGGPGVTSLWDLGNNLQALNIGTAGATGNVVTVDGQNTPGSAVITNMMLTLGGGGIGNSFVVVNGGRAYSLSTITIAGAAGATNNCALVSGAGSLWNANAVAMTIGIAGTTNNLLVVNDGGSVTNLGATGIGGISNGIQVLTGGRLHVGLLTVGNAATATNAYFTLDGGTLILTNGLSIGGERSLVTITNPVLVSAKGPLTVGASGNNDFFRIPGNDIPVWNINAGALTVGSAGTTNHLLVVDGAVVTNVGGLIQAVGIGNGLILTNGGSIYGSGAAQVYLAPASTNSYLLMDHATLSLTGSSVVDMNGKSGQVVVANSSRINTSAGGSIGDNPRGGFNTVLVAGGSAWNCTNGSLTLGSAGCSNNTFTIDNSTAAFSSTLDIGDDTAGGSYNTLIITNGGRFSLGSSGIIGSRYSSFNTVRVVGGAGVTSLWAMVGATHDLSIGRTYASNTANIVTIDGAGVPGSAVLTNVAIGTITGSSNGVVVANGGWIFASGAGVIGAAGMNSNFVTVSGTGSILNMAGGSMTVGATGATNNVLTIDQGGTVDNINILTVVTNNSVNLYGGTLGVTNASVGNGQLFAVGDGAQAATLKALGGTLTSSNGLLVAGNATLKGLGTISGGPVGVLITNGATFTPGLSGPGTLTFGGSNLAWNSGGTYLCEITDVNPGPGLGWDMMNVSSQLVLNGSGLVIKMDSMGGPAANFDAGRDYNLRILNYGTQTGYDPANITIDTSAFLSGGTWTITNLNNSLYLLYRGAAAPATPDYTWDVSSNGNWSVDGNWLGRSAPAPDGSPAFVLNFGDNGTPYASTDDLAGAFLMNQLQFASVSGVTNQIKGGVLVLTNSGGTGARMDFLSGAGGTFIVSNKITLASDTVFGGDAFAGVVALNGTVTNLGTMTKNGSWTLALGNANNFSGPVVLDSPGGVLRMDNNGALTGTGKITVSNGIIVSAAAIFANAKHNRQGLLKGSGAMWTNTSVFTACSAATNVQFVVDGGKLYAAFSGMNWFTAGSKDGVFAITNGGQVFDYGNAVALGDASTNCQLLVTGTNSALYNNQVFYVAISGGSNNSIIVEKGGLIWGGNNFSLRVGGGTRNNRYVVRDGGLVWPYGLYVQGSNNTALITGIGSLVNGRGAGYMLTLGSGVDFGNAMTIADQAAVTNLTMQLATGAAYSNTLAVTNGGRLFAAAAVQYIAYGATGAVGNTVTVTGSNSLWNLSAQNLWICQDTGTVNRLLVQDSGVVTNVLNLIVASGAAASNNGVTVDGGRLYATTIATSNNLPNDFTLTGSGQAYAANFIATNLNFSVNLYGGTLNVTRWLLSSNGVPFVVGDGTQAAVLNIQPGATNVFASGLIVTNHAYLGGVGKVSGTTTVYGIVSPALTGLGGLTNAGDLTFAGNSVAVFDMATNTTPGVGWDQLVVSNGTLTLGGALKVVLNGGFVPAKTDTFVVMTNTTADMVGSFPAGTAPAYASNDLAKAVGWFSIDLSNPRTVVLKTFSAGALGSMFIIR